VRWYGILIMLGVIAGAYLASWLARRKGENPDHLWNMVPIVVFSAIAGARVWWVFLSWNTCCANDPMQALNIRGGGISIHGAIAFGTLAVWFFARYYQLRFFRWIDIIVPALALGQAIGRWGNFANQEAFGNPTSLPWGIYIAPEHRPAAYAAFEHFHPTFLYESLYNLAACVVLAWVCLLIGRDHHPRAGTRLRDGDAAWLYLIGYGLARFAIESIRTDSLNLGPFKAAHVISAALLAIGIAGLLVGRLIGTRGGEDRGRHQTRPGAEVGDVPTDPGGLRRLGRSDAGGQDRPGPRPRLGG
jgi:phosphatidylglycerol:prolipoprotein diacylglycerol transferase